MNPRNRPRRPARRPRPSLPLRPLPLPAEPGPQDARRLEAPLYVYLKRVLVDGETPECGAGTAAMLAGMVLGQQVLLLQASAGMPQPRAVAESLQWIAGQAALSGSLAATDEPAEAADTPSPGAARAGAAAYTLAVMDGSTPGSCPAWLPSRLAMMLRAALVSGFMQADGLDREAAVGATRAKLAAMTEEVN